MECAYCGSDRVETYKKIGKNICLHCGRSWDIDKTEDIKKSEGTNKVLLGGTPISGVATIQPSYVYFDATRAFPDDEMPQPAPARRPVLRRN